MGKGLHDHGVPLIVDNTFATPVNCRPLGGGECAHSTINIWTVHGSAVGGAIVDGGNFDWAAHANKFPGAAQPDPSYHNLVYADTFGNGGALL